MKQTCILVLGMHRSGTSALTGVLSILDIYLGNKLLSASNDNSKGYFENDNLYRINEKLLAQMGSSWDDVFFFEDKPNDLFEIKEIKELKKQLKNEFEYSKVFAIKDPRLAFLFPVYRKVLEELGVNIKVIIPYRNPMEVAKSLHKRNGFVLEKSLLLWTYHMLLAEKASRDYNRVFIEFDELITDTKNVINLISEKLDLGIKSKYVKKRKQINEFLEADLKHYNISIDNLSDNVPKIIHDILSFREVYNNEPICEKFDSLRLEVFGYQKLFYNQSIIKTFLNLNQTQQTLNKKEQEVEEQKNRLKEVLVKKEQELEIKKINVEEISRVKEQAFESQKNKLEKILLEKDHEIEIQKNKLEEILFEKDHEIESQKRKLEETLHEREQAFDSQNNQLKESLHEKEQEVKSQKSKQHKLKEDLEVSNNYLENILANTKIINESLQTKTKELKQQGQVIDDLLNSKSWKLTEPVRKIIGYISK